MHKQPNAGEVVKLVLTRLLHAVARARTARPAAAEWGAWGPAQRWRGVFGALVS